MNLPHLASRLYGTPLLLARAKLDVILSVLGERVNWPESDLAVPSIQKRPSIDAPVGIAVISVVGSLVRRTVGLDPASGFTSYAEIAGMVDAALSDPSVEGIVLDIDSPGGEAGGVFELGERIRAADAIKPVWAVSADSAFSAAYAIGCSASRLMVSRTGGVGSIGVIAMHVDQTARDAQQGYRYTPITAGDHKNDFSPHEKLTPDAHARLQAEVDRLYGLFVDHVAAMRQLDVDAVRATEAGIYFGPDAVASGLADAVGGLDAVLAEFSSFLVARRARGHAVSGSTRPLVTPSAASPSTLMENTSMTTPENQEHPASTESTVPEQTTDSSTPAPAAPVPEAARSDAVAIAELCQLAGYPERTAAFLAEGVSEAQVRKALLASRADSPEIRSTIAPDASAPQQSQSAANPLMAAVKKLTGKE
ncbi:MAG: S49 family peptidase [Alphaproteobacteria bacterium]|nr:S49 family peptidase [Alphaproteobacteria bacterium]